MGRRKIRIEPIRESRPRQVTFNKRKQGLFKKASELSRLCGCDVTVIVFDKRRLVEFSSSNVPDVIRIWQTWEGKRVYKSPADFLGGNIDGEVSMKRPDVTGSTQAVAEGAPERRERPFRHEYVVPSTTPAGNTDVRTNFPNAPCSRGLTAAYHTAEVPETPHGYAVMAPSAPDMPHLPFVSQTRLAPTSKPSWQVPLIPEIQTPSLPSQNLLSSTRGIGNTTNPLCEGLQETPIMTYDTNAYKMGNILPTGDSHTQQDLLNRELQPSSAPLLSLPYPSSSTSSAHLQYPAIAQHVHPTSDVIVAGSLSSTSPTSQGDFAPPQWGLPREHSHGSAESGEMMVAPHGAQPFDPLALPPSTVSPASRHVQPYQNEPSCASFTEFDIHHGHQPALQLRPSAIACTEGTIPPSQLAPPEPVEPQHHAPWPGSPFESWNQPIRLVCKDAEHTSDFQCKSPRAQTSHSGAGKPLFLINLASWPNAEGGGDDDDSKADSEDPVSLVSSSPSPGPPPPPLFSCSCAILTEVAAGGGITTDLAKLDHEREKCGDGDCSGRDRSGWRTVEEE